MEEPVQFNEYRVLAGVVDEDIDSEKEPEDNDALIERINKVKAIDQGRKPSS